MKTISNKVKKSFGIIEVIVAVGIFLIISVGSIGTIIRTFSSNRLAEEYSQANLLAQEGIEAVRSVKKQSWGNLSPGLHGLNNSLGSWILTDTQPDIIGKFTRSINVSTVSRLNNNIVETGGTIDPNTYKVDSTVTWNFTPSRTNTITQSTYLTYFEKLIGGNWANPMKESSINIAGNQNGVKVQIQGNYAYLITDGTTNNFHVINITNTLTPVLSSSLSLPSNLNNLVVSGSYAYVSSSDNNAEMMIINITNPSSSSLVGTFNANGTIDGMGIAINNTTVYLGRAGGKDDEFVVINVSNPSAPTQIGSINFNFDINEIYVNNNYAYLATSDNGQELTIINVSTPTNPISAGSLNLSSNNDAISIIGKNNNLYIGRFGNELNIVNVTNPISPILSSTFNANNQVNDVVVNDDETIAFIGTNDNVNDFKTVNITNKSTPVILGNYNSTGNILGVSYSQTKDRVAAANKNNAEEFIIFRPQ